MGQASITLNPGIGGALAAAWQDVSLLMHQQVVLQTQSGTSDPVSVGASNPLPIAIPAALPAGANIIGAITQSGNWLIQGNIAAGNTDAGNGIKISGVYNSAPPTYTNGQRADFQTDANGNLKVTITSGSGNGTSSNFAASFPTVGTAVGASDGTNMRALLVDGSGNLKINIAAGGVASATDNSGFTAGTTQGLAIQGVYNDGISNLTSGDSGTPRLTATRQLYVAPQANVIGGWSPYRLISAATTNATSVKGSPGSLGSIICGNVGATVAYLKLYNKASAPTVGTDTPVHTIMIPGNTAGAGFSYPIPAGLSFTTGIALAVTGLMADTDTTAVALNQVCVNLGYL